MSPGEPSPEGFIGGISDLPTVKPTPIIAPGAALTAKGRLSNGASGILIS
jgi:hypothetical protein